MGYVLQSDTLDDQIHRSGDELDLQEASDIGDWDPSCGIDVYDLPPNP